MNAPLYMGVLVDEKQDAIVDQTDIVREDSRTALEDAFDILPTDGNLVVDVKQVRWETLEEYAANLVLGSSFIAVAAVTFVEWWQ